MQPRLGRYGRMDRHSRECPPVKSANWTYRLAKPCSLQAPRGQAAAWRALQARYISEASLERLCAQPAAALLLQLDQAGLLARELRLGARPWARAQPRRAPDAPPPTDAPRGRLTLTAGVVVHPGTDGLTLEAPGAWACVQLLQPGLMGLLDALARGCSLARARQVVPDAADLVPPLLQLLSWCGLLADSVGPAWAVQDLLFHSRTRRGFGPAPVGKRQAAPGKPAPLPQGQRLALAKGRPDDLPASLARTLAARRSRREHGAGGLPLADLERFLWHTLAAQPSDGHLHRPYPGAGGCYALQAYLLAARVNGLDAGLYAYDAVGHALILVGGDAAAGRALMRDAAGSAQCRAQPHALLVLCSDYERLRDAYGDLGYGLVLKEVGAIMQTAQLVSTAMDLACCPLGTGNAVQFARLSGSGLWQLPAVGELLLGAPA